MAKSKIPQMVGVGIIAVVTIYILFVYLKIQQYFTAAPKTTPSDGSGSTGQSGSLSGDQQKQDQSNANSNNTNATNTTNNNGTQETPSTAQTSDQRAQDLVDTLKFASNEPTTIPATTKTVTTLATEASQGGTSVDQVLARYEAQQQYLASADNKFTSASEKAAASTVTFVPAPNGFDASTVLANARNNPPASSRAGIINVSLLAAAGKLPTTLTAEQVLGLPQVKNF